MESAVRLILQRFYDILPNFPALSANMGNGHLMSVYKKEQKALNPKKTSRVFAKITLKELRHFDSKKSLPKKPGYYFKTCQRSLSTSV